MRIIAIKFEMKRTLSFKKKLSCVDIFWFINNTENEIIVCSETFSFQLNPLKYSLQIKDFQTCVIFISLLAIYLKKKFFLNE